MKNFFYLLFLLFPWKIRRILLNKFLGYQIHPKAYIGMSWIFPKYLYMEAYAKIDHFTIAIHLDEIKLSSFSKIGRGNWITGYSSKYTKHFSHVLDRKSILYLGNHSAITKNHHIDCTDMIFIDEFVTIAGYNSQFLTHSIDLENCRQHCAPIYIGSHSFIGTNCVILGGSSLPSFSVLSAKSLLNKTFIEKYVLYGGVPAKSIKPLSVQLKYFNRSIGFIT